MDSKDFNKKLDTIFFKESVIPADASIVDPGLNSIDIFKNMVNQRLRGLKKTQVGTPPEEVPQKGPGVVAVMDERNNPISVGTIKNQVQNFGPEGLSQVISKLSADMNKTDSNGQPTSEYNQFVDSIKQDGLELILKVSASAGGVKMAPGGTPNAPGGTPPEDPNKKEPGDELASL